MCLVLVCKVELKFVLLISLENGHTFVIDDILEVVIIGFFKQMYHVEIVVCDRILQIESSMRVCDSGGHVLKRDDVDISIIMIRKIIFDLFQE